MITGCRGGTQTRIVGQNPATATRLSRWVMTARIVTGWDTSHFEMARRGAFSRSTQPARRFQQLFAGYYRDLACRESQARPLVPKCDDLIHNR
jgi:hypothetical protein